MLRILETFKNVRGPITFFFNIYKILSIAVFYALMTVLASSTTFQLKIKESILIQWAKPTLNHQLYHVNLKLFKVELMRKNDFKKDLLALPPRKCFHFYNIRK